VHFLNGIGQITSSGPPGAVISSWNQYDLSNNGILINQVVTDGNGNTAVVTANSDGSGSTFQTGHGVTDPLLQTYLYGADVPTVVTNIPYANYTLYVISADSSGGTVGKLNEQITVGSNNFYYTPEYSNYTQITNTSSTSYPLGNYAVIPNLSGSVSITCESFAGFEIIDTTGPGVNVIPTTTPVSISNGGSLDMTNNIQTVASLSSTDGMGSQVLVGSGALTIAGPATTTFDGTISGGGGSVTLQGGLLTLTGSNTYSGPTTVSGGTLQLGTGANGFDGSIASTSGVVVNGAIVYNIAGSQTVAYPINSGTGSVTKTGSGTLTLTNPGNSSFTGTTNINAGLVVIAPGTNALGQGPLNMSGGSLDLEGNVSSQGVLSLNGSGMIGNGASGAGNEALFVINDGGNFSGTIQDGGFGGNAPVELGLGGGTLILSGTNTYSGGTIVADGTLVLTNNQAIAAGSSLTVGDPGLFGSVLPAATVAPVLTPVPEPGTLAMLAMAGLITATAIRRRRSK
jgi:autotransporter-associated beta strand protein